MNGFQEKLSALLSEFERAGRRVCGSERVSRLDVDVLGEKMRQIYDFLLSSDWNEIEEVKHVLPVSEELTIERVETKAEKPANETPIRRNETAEEKIEMPKEFAETPFSPEPEQVIENENKETKEKEEEKKPLKEEPKQVEVVSVEPEVVTTEESEEEKEVEEEKPEAKEEESKDSHSSVLSYLHHNIMREGEEKPKPQVGSTLDLFAEKTPSIAERFESRTRSDLRTAIGVSEKFMFINDLFSGNLKEYTDFINKLNDLTTWDMSKLVIEETRQKKKWAAASLAYTTLQDLIHKRFEK